LQRFNHAFAANSAEDFIRLILVDQLKVRAVVTGEDFVFGHRRGGDAALLAAAAKNYGFTYTATPMQENEAGVISSSRIRDALAAGDMVLAAKLLGRNYTLSGRIVKGEQRGRQWGFPTANLIPSKLFYPAFGIYAVRLHLATDSYTGVANFGIRPMYPLQSPLLEAHLLDASPDLYGQQVRVELLHFLRPEARFADEDALRVQIALDCDAARQWLRSEVTSNI
jgi:riboflavin kinase/FMN adenylyltransferase